MVRAYSVIIGSLARSPITSEKSKNISKSRSKAPAASDGSAAESNQLRAILDTLDSGLLRVASGPVDRDVQITDVVIFDPADSETLAAGAIILAVGTSPETHDGAALIERAGERRAAALVFRHDGPIAEGVQRLAASSGVTVLTALQDVRWAQVYSLLRTALTSLGDFHLPVEAGVPIGDLFGLADVIAMSVGGPVTIEDPNWQVLSYSNLDFEIDQARRETILGRTPPSPWRARLSGVATALRNQDDVIRFEGKPGERFAPRLVAPVRAGDELLGSVWVAEGATPLDANAERELTRAAKLAAVHLLSHRASDDIKRRTRGAFVREVLEGWAPAQSAISTLRVSGPFTVLVFAVDDVTLSSRGSRLARALSLVSLHFESRHPDAMTALIEDKIWCVLPALSADEPNVAVKLAETVVDVVEASLGVRLFASVGPTVPGIADIPRSRQAAEQGLKVLMRRGESRVTHIDDVRARAILLEIIDWASLQPELSEGKLARLIEHDRKHRTSYQETLRAYLDARGDIRSAAKGLCVHTNTLRYRLQRLIEISGLDLDDPDERLATELQLRMH